MQVEVHGPGIKPDGVPSNKPTHFTVDVRKAGQAPLEVKIQDGLGREVPLKLDDKRDGTVQCHYTPTSGSQHVVMVTIKNFKYCTKFLSDLQALTGLIFFIGELRWSGYQEITI